MLRLKCFFFSTMPTAAAEAAAEAAPSSVHLCSLVCKTLAGSPCIFNTCTVISSRFAHLLCRGGSFPEVRALSPLACKTQKLCLKCNKNPTLKKKKCKSFNIWNRTIQTKLDVVNFALSVHQNKPPLSKQG